MAAATSLGVAASGATSWRDLGLSPWLSGACTEMGLRRPTPIQVACIPPALQGKDILGSAETGSGKTAAFALPILQALSEDPFGVFAVVLSPARELSSQIAEQFSALGARMQVRVAVVVGGVDMMHQALLLSERPHVVIGTPGRLADHLRSSGGAAAAMRNTRFLVIDEADRMLEQGFSEDLGAILQRLPAQRQTLLFSATMSRALERLQRLALRAPHVADLSPAEGVPGGLTLEYIFVPSNVRDAYLTHVVRGLAESGLTAVVFTSTCRACEELSVTLKALGVECAPLHSQQPQARRLAAIGRFKQGTLKLLVATDVAARGIDIPQVGAVVNHNVPALPRDFVHRCGRTARAGRAGRAVTLVSQYDVEVLLAIEGAIGRKMVALEPDEDEVLASLHEVASARRAALLELTESGFLEKEKQRRAERKAERLAAEDGEGRGGGEEAGVVEE
jgi:ATP-dependent RNA helicase DDX49/DBP8